VTGAKSLEKVQRRRPGIFSGPSVPESGCHAILVAVSLRPILHVLWQPSKCSCPESDTCQFLPVPRRLNVPLIIFQKPGGANERVAKEECASPVQGYGIGDEPKAVRMLRATDERKTLSCLAATSADECWRRCFSFRKTRRRGKIRSTMTKTPSLPRNAPVKRQCRPGFLAGVHPLLCPMAALLYPAQCRALFSLGKQGPSSQTSNPPVIPMM